MGRQQAELRNWLHRGSSVPPDNQTEVVQQGKAYLRSVEIELTSKQIMGCSTYRNRGGTEYSQISGMVRAGR